MLGNHRKSRADYDELLTRVEFNNYKASYLLL
jgi:hypothetical protein